MREVGDNLNLDEDEHARFDKDMEKMKSSFVVTMLILSPLVVIAGIVLMSFGEGWGIAVFATAVLCLAWGLVAYFVRRKRGTSRARN